MTELERLTDIICRAFIMLRTTTDPATRTALMQYAEECEAKAALLRASDSRQPSV